MKFIYQPGQLNAQTSIYEKNGVEYAEFTGEIIYGNNAEIKEKHPDKVVSDYLCELNDKREPNSPEFIICEYEVMKAMKNSLPLGKKSRRHNGTTHLIACRPKNGKQLMG
jgi:hypothetical protein